LENKNKDFDVDLKKSDILIYNFINQMKDIYIEPNRIRIGGSFYVFIKLYEKEIGREIQKDELEKAVEKAKSGIENFKRAMENLRELGKSSLKARRKL
jgi:benzoyl-CoA reductase/2-hydroxyglutaryl-CoA dehydratase subunit BcrC/BadD/HgdB